VLLNCYSPTPYHYIMPKIRHLPAGLNQKGKWLGESVWLGAGNRGHLDTHLVQLQIRNRCDSVLPWQWNHRDEGHMTLQSPAIMTHPVCFASRAIQPPADWTEQVPHQSGHLCTHANVIGQSINQLPSPSGSCAMTDRPTQGFTSHGYGMV